MAERPRTRTHKVQLWVDEDEYVILQKTARQTHRSMSEVLRDYIIYGELITLNTSHLERLLGEMGRIGNNLNQIAHRLNANGSFYAEDAEQMRQKCEELFRAFGASETAKAQAVFDAFLDHAKEKTAG